MSASSSAGISIGEEEKHYLGRELEAYAPAATGSPAPEQWAALATAVRSGALTQEQLDRIAPLLQLLLETGRLRARYGPHAEMSGSRLFLRTEKGRSLKSSADGVNQALAGLGGQLIQRLTCSVIGPSRYELSIDTDKCRVQLAIDRDGFRVKTVELGV